MINFRQAPWALASYRPTTRATVRRVLGVLAAMAAAVPLTLTATLFAGLERSIWVTIAIEAEHANPPALRVAYSADPAEMLPVIWEDAEPSTLLGLWADRPVRLLSIDTDRGAIAPWLAQTWASNWQRTRDPAGLLVQGTGAFELLGTFRRLTLTFERSTAIVDVGWRDRRATIDLSSRPASTASVTLALPGVRRGWVLLPPRAIERLAIHADAGMAAFTLRDVIVRGPRPQHWTPHSGLADPFTGNPRCGWTFAEGTGRVDAATAGCDLPLRGVGRLNRVSVPLTLGIWIGVTAALLCALWAVARAAAFVRRFTGAGDAATTSVPRPIPLGSATWTAWKAAGVVTLCALVYHLTYALSVPAHFNFDSLGYYAFGHNLLHTGELDAIGTCRTPGYPAAIAASIRWFGEELQPIVVGQHLALALLGPLVVWFLYPHVGPLWATIGGLLAGISPIMALAATVIWTEALFTVFGTASLLVFLRRRTPGPGALGTAGALAGFATLIRPNGAVLVALMIGWLFLRWWCETSAAPLSALVRRVGAVVGAFALVTALWIGHFHKVTGHWGLSDANCSLDGQTHALAARGLKPTNIFELAGFTNLMAQSDDVATLAIAEPYRAFFQFFPARHRYRAERFLPWQLVYDNRFTGELFREYTRTLPATYLRQVGDALLFNLTHVERSGASVFAYADLTGVLQIQKARAPSPAAVADPQVAALARSSTLTWAQADALMQDASARRPVRSSPARAFHLRVSEMAMALWGGLVVLAAFGVVTCTLRPGYRRFLVLGWHALVLSAAPAVLAMGADRYAMVSEPVLYVLLVLAISYALDRLRWRRAAATPSGVLSGS